MYFETFSRDAVDQLSETGPFYVRHKDGRMRAQGRAHAMGPPEKRRRLEPPRAAELSRRSSNTSPANGAPRKLFSLCLDFVAENIHLVDSLVDFPEVVGHQLFKAVQDTGRFGVPGEAARTLGLFCEAYGALVLSSLTVRGQVLPLNDYLQPEIQYMSALQQLDLSNCGLGDEHGILGEVAHMPSLTQLSLQGNCLSHRGVQRVTLPYKMFGRGPAGMEVFSLADNAELNDRVLGCLVPFKRLRAVNLSKTSLTKSGIKKLCDLGWSEWTETLPEFSEDNAIRNVGWAQKVVEDWLHPAKTQNDCLPTIPDNGNASDQRSLSLRKFYRKTLPPKLSCLKNQHRRLQGHLHLYRKVTNTCQGKYTSEPTTQGKLSFNLAQHRDSSDDVTFEKTKTQQRCTQGTPLLEQDRNKSLKKDNNTTVVVREQDEENFDGWSDEEGGDLFKSYLQPESKPSPKLSLFSAMDSERWET